MGGSWHARSLSEQLRWAVLVLSLCGQGALLCPEGCQCAWDSGTVHCANAGLREVPTDIPRDTVSLHLEGNQISTIPDGAFQNLPHLRDLYLSHNRIENLSPGAFRHLSPDLKLLDLSDNQLRQANREDFGSTRAKTRLYHNPWHCTCALQELMETLNLEPETVNGIVCESSARGGEHAGQPLVKLLDAGVNFCSLQRKTTDVAMLVTMFAWFGMVIAYVVYYVRQNQAEARRHLEYLKSLPSPRKTPTETDTLSTGF
ncbi:leucine-rich repeat-containing protein 3-like [Lepisosteus oculatus]|nr:PREDICTED: leucine-rich repeat-containing protein 3-like [Lepisosteus oculatus]XP_015199620.1 PREDICTED: leucine-rich repeat-containing protein 3-like [Lepisosteus oculatus]XP_015199621.1 PREDICTED: leucine-rich repeat-containing protein 3-like [Lepisosteus oculatus]XP_015199622.1 PREDICTED: leucine-rich repeat-containing protein 3-like [Lepisosteus oculatus]XP_015199623.1 PREDICTED: leucine-rich repeat-containing protein 3-like [Lepisosteus oculatus]